MSSSKKKTGDGSKQYVQGRKSPWMDFIKIILLAVVIGAAGWGISSRGDKINKAEELADIASTGVADQEGIQQYRQMIEEGNLGDAIIGLRKITRTNETNFVAHYFLGIAFAKKGLHDEALVEFEKVIELGSGWQDKAYYNIGILYESLGFYDRAYGAYAAAGQSNPEITAYNRARDKVDYLKSSDFGYENQYSKRFNEAAAALVAVPPNLEFASNSFTHLMEKFPHKVEPVHMLGVVKARQGKLEEAEELFLQAIEMEPGYALSHYDLGITYQVRGMWRKAYDSFLKAQRLMDEKDAEVVGKHIEQVKQYITELNP